MKREELAARLRATFAAELEEQVREANAHLLALEAMPADGEALRALFRVVHTLKGAARAAGAAETESLCHELEALLAELRDDSREPTRIEITRLFAGLDTLDAQRQALRQDGGESGGAASPGGTGAPPAASPEVDAGQPRATPPEASPRVRVSGQRIDQLVTSASQLLIAAARTDARPERLWRLQASVARAAAQLRHAALRGGMPTTTDEPLWQTLRAAAEDLERLAGDTQASGRELRALAEELSGGVRALRMRPFGDAVQALPRLVRDLAADTGKQVRLEVVGEDVEADRAVLEEVEEALLHLVRNAVDHGIEPPEQRLGLGKPAQGVVRVAAELLSDRLLVSVSDDGGGLDIDSLRVALARAGRSLPAEDRDVVRALFAGGISTRRDAGVISGRGVGLDAARAAMERARGSLDVSWTAGVGASFVLDAPLTLAGIRAVLVGAGPHLLAVPTAFVQRLVRVRTEELREVEGRVVLLTDDVPVVVVPLADLLGAPFSAPPPATMVRGVLLHVGAQRALLTVDGILSEQELTVRPITARGGGALPHVTGAALLPNGRVTLVLNARSLVGAALRAGPAGSLAPAPAAASPARHRILVVDDSLTTRALEESLLEAAGYDVVTAVDGADAWARLQERGAELVVADLEMPRMDGFQLCQAMRASSRFRTVPVVLVTALETDAHRARGLEVGADAYLPKSSFDQETLLETIQQLLG